MGKHKAPKYYDLFLDTLKVVAALGGSASIDEILAGVIERRKFADDVVDEMHKMGYIVIYWDKKKSRFTFLKRANPRHL